MIVTVAFGKGGTGKTTTSLAMAHYAASHPKANGADAAAASAGSAAASAAAGSGSGGRRVLCVDLDHQANMTYALGGDPATAGMFEVLTGACDAQDVLQEVEDVDLLPAGLNLAAVETAIVSKPGRDFLLRAALEPIQSDYDLIVIDTRPDLNSLLVNALSASDQVLLPMRADSFSVMGLYQMGETIAQVKKLCNPGLEVAGIVLTQFKPRQVLARDMREGIEQQALDMGTRVFDSYIREGVVAQQAQAMRMSIFEYAPESNPAKDYESLFVEMGI